MIGLLLVAIAVVLAVETKSLLLGESATKDDVARIRTAIEAGGTWIIHLKTLHLGPEELLVAAKISIGRADYRPGHRPGDRRRRGPDPRGRADRPGHLP